MSQCDDQERVLDTNGKVPMHPAWNDSGTRLIVSLEGCLRRYQLNREFIKLTDCGFDVLPQFDKGDIVFFRRGATKRLPSDQITAPNQGSAAVENAEFDMDYVCDHPSVTDEMAAEIFQCVSEVEGGF